MNKIEDPADVGVFITASMKVQRKKNTTFQNSLPHTYHVVTHTNFPWTQNFNV